MVSTAYFHFKDNNFLYVKPHLFLDMWVNVDVSDLTLEPANFYNWPFLTVVEYF